MVITICLAIEFRTNSTVSYGMDSQTVGPGQAALETR